MNPWPFVIGAYSVAILLTGVLLLWSFASMRRAEAAVDALRGSHPNTSTEGEGRNT